MKNILFLLFLSVFALNLHPAEAGKDMDGERREADENRGNRYVFDKLKADQTNMPLVDQATSKMLIGTPQKISPAFLPAISHELEVSGFIQEIKISDDGKLIVAALAHHDHSSIKIWDSSGKLISTFWIDNKYYSIFSDHANIANSILISPNNRFIAVGFCGFVKIFDINGNLIEIFNINDNPNGFSSIPMAISADNRWIIVAHNNRVTIWDLISNTLIHDFLHNNFVESVAISHDKKNIVSGTHNGIITVWNAENGNRIIAFAENNNHKPVYSIIINAENNLLASSSKQNIKIWDIDGNLIQVIKHYIDDGFYINHSINGSMIISGYMQSQLWDIQGKLIQDIIILNDDYHLRNITTSPDLKFIIIFSKEPKILIRLTNQEAFNILKNLKIEQLELINDLYESKTFKATKRVAELDSKKTKIFKSLPPFIQKSLNYHYNIHLDTLGQKLYDNRERIAAIALAALAYVKRRPIKNALKSLAAKIANKFQK